MSLSPSRTFSHHIEITLGVLLTMSVLTSVIGLDEATAVPNTALS